MNHLLRAAHLGVAMLLAAVMVTACGGGGGGNNTTSASSGSLMGGSVQTTALNLTGVDTTLAGEPAHVGFSDGTGAAANFNQPYAVTTDGTSLYVADWANQTIRKVDIATGAVTTLAGQPGVQDRADGAGSAARFNYPAGITTDGSNLYVADSYNAAVRKIVIATGVVSTLASSALAYGSPLNNPQGITTDGTHLYVADTGSDTILAVSIATGQVTTLAGQAGVAGSTDGTGTAASFNRPKTISSDGTNLYVVDSGDNAIRKIVIASGVVTTLSTTLGTVYGGVYGITVDAGGSYLYVSEQNSIHRITLADGTSTVVAGGASIGFADGTGTAAGFDNPYGLATDGTNLYVADTGNNTIRQVVLGTAVVTTLAGQAGGASGSADGVATAATFDQPVGVTTDGSNLYVADRNNYTIRKIVIATGAVTTLAGQAGISGAIDGTGSAASFGYPQGITTDGSNLYVADTGNDTVRKIAIATGVVTTLAGQAGVRGFADGTGSAASFYSPYGVTTDGTNLYVTDTYNNTIRKIVIATGAVTTLAGQAGVHGSADGIGTGATFYRPAGITTDGTNLYVADTDNDTVRQIAIADGTVTTVAGQAGVQGFADGTGSAASFMAPSDITSDGTNLYLSDTLNDTVRKIDIATGTVTTLNGTVGYAGSANGTGALALFDKPQGLTTDGYALYVVDTRNNAIREVQ